MNKTLKLLSISDIFISGGFGLITPIIAIFIAQQLRGGSIFTAGLASTIYLITYASLQILFSYKFNPKDRLWMLRLGTLLIVLTPFGYVLSKVVFNHVYALFAVEFIHGLGAALSYPSWSSLFTSHLEKGRRGFQYSIYSSSVAIGSAITAGVGAFIAEKVGFITAFLITGAINFIGLFVLFGLEKKILRKT